ncbi:hypothetical protein [Bacillus sp. AK128]
MKKCLICSKALSNVKRKFCSNRCVGVYNSSARRKRIETKCAWCGKKIEVIPSELKEKNYCSRTHMGYVNAKRLGANIEQVQNELEFITWTKEIAYLLGIIATDGTLRKNRKQFKISSYSKEFIDNLIEIISGITGRTHYANHLTPKFNGKIFDHYQVQFTSYPLYDFCLAVGITSNKTYIMNEINIPNVFFSDFLRGTLDGDGNYNVVKDGQKRKVKVRLYSGSKSFLTWINRKCIEVYNLHGGKIYQSTNELGSKYILVFQSEFDSYTILKKIYEDASYSFIEKRKEVEFFLSSIDKLLATCKKNRIGVSLYCAQPNCNKKFTANSHNQIYCSYACRMKKKSS